MRPTGALAVWGASSLALDLDGLDFTQVVTFANAIANRQNRLGIVGRVSQDTLRSKEQQEAGDGKLIPLILKGQRIRQTEER